MELPRSSTGRSGRSPWLILAFAVATGAMALQRSRSAGRLSAIPNWDDSIYLLRAARAVNALHQEGLAAWLRLYHSWPPHSVVSDLLASAGHLVLGMNAGAAYSFTFVLLALLLWAVDLAAGEVPRSWRIALLAVVCLLPSVRELLTSLQPDLAAGVLLTLGVVLLYRVDPLEGRLRDLAVALASFAMAVLARPHFAPYLVPLFAFAIAWSVLLSHLRRSPGERNLARAGGRVATLVVLPLVPVALHVWVAWGWIRAYVGGVRAQPIWWFHGSLRDHILFYHREGVLQFVLGPGWAVVCLAAAIVLACLSGGAGRRRALFFGPILLVAWMGITLSPYKGLRSASLAAIILLAWALGSLGDLAVESRRPWRWLGALPLALLIPLLLAWVPPRMDRWFGDGITDPSNRAHLRASEGIVQAVVDLLSQRAPGDGPPRIYVTSDGYLNRDNLRLMLFYRGLFEVETSHLAFDGALSKVQDEIARSDLVVANDSGANWSWGLIPSEGLQDQLVATLRGSSQVRLAGTFPSVAGRNYYLFVRPRDRAPVLP